MYQCVLEMRTCFTVTQDTRRPIATKNEQMKDFQPVGMVIFQEQE